MRGGLGALAATGMLACGGGPHAPSPPPPSPPAAASIASAAAAPPNAPPDCDRAVRRHESGVLVFVGELVGVDVHASARSRTPWRDYRFRPSAGWHGVGGTAEQPATFRRDAEGRPAIVTITLPLASCDGPVPCRPEERSLLRDLEPRRAYFVRADHAGVSGTLPTLAEVIEVERAGAAIEALGPPCWRDR